MSDVTGRPTPEASQLQGLLRKAGFPVLAVIPDPAEAGWFTVYVQGLDGSNGQETVFDFLATVSGVRELQFSEQTSAILRVYREPADRT